MDIFICFLFIAAVGFIATTKLKRDTKLTFILLDLIVYIGFLVYIIDKYDLNTTSLLILLIPVFVVGIAYKIISYYQKKEKLESFENSLMSKYGNVIFNNKKIDIYSDPERRTGSFVTTIYGSVFVESLKLNIRFTQKNSIYYVPNASSGYLTPAYNCLENKAYLDYTLNNNYSNEALDPNIINKLNEIKKADYVINNNVLTVSYDTAYDFLNEDIDSVLPLIDAINNMLIKNINNSDKTIEAREIIKPLSLPDNSVSPYKTYRKVTCILCVIGLMAVDFVFHRDIAVILFGCAFILVFLLLENKIRKIAVDKYDILISIFLIFSFIFTELIFRLFNIQ